MNTTIRRVAHEFIHSSQHWHANRQGDEPGHEGQVGSFA